MARAALFHVRSIKLKEPPPGVAAKGHRFQGGVGKEDGGEIFFSGLGPTVAWLEGEHARIRGQARGGRESPTISGCGCAEVQCDARLQGRGAGGRAAATAAGVAHGTQRCLRKTHAGVAGGVPEEFAAERGGGPQLGSKVAVHPAGTSRR